MIITLIEAKAQLNVIHDSDDAKIVEMIEAAEDEAKCFLNRPHLPLRNEECPSECGSEISSVDESSGSEIVPSAKRAVLLAVDLNYYMSKYTPYEIQVRRARFEELLMPYRCGIGV